MGTELFTADRATTTVSSGGTTAPVSGTQETWTVASSAMFGAASTAVSQFHVADPLAPSEIIAVTNVSGTTWTVTRGAESTTPVVHAAGFTVYQVATAGFLGALMPKVTTVVVPAPTGATATDTPAVTAAITSLAAALGSGPATLQFQDGTYQVDSNALVIRNCSNFAVKGSGATVIAQAPNRSGLVNNTTGDLFVIADCTDFRVEDITFDGMRDTVAPVTPLTASASSGQPSVTVASGNGARYIAGQYVNVFGGLGSSEQAQADNWTGSGGGTPSLVVSSVMPGGGSGGGDLITFTTNLAHSYTQISSTVFSDGFGPYAYAGAYLTPYQTGAGNAVAGRTLGGEDQQNGLHLISCQRFTITRVTGRNTWESPIKLGTGFAATTLTDGCQQGTVSDCIAYHGYDQGVSVWVSQNVAVEGCVANAAGWGGISLTGSDYCTVTGNEVLNSVYRVPTNTQAGMGIAIEGGLRNQVKGNVITSPYYYGILARQSPLFFGLPTPSNPTITNFLEADTAAGTSILVSSTSGMAAGGLYSILDGSRSEAVTIASVVDGTHVTFAQQTGFSHAAGVSFTVRVAQENVIEGNTIYNPGSSGISSPETCRNVIKNNVITNYGSLAGTGARGIDLGTQSISMPTGKSLGGDGAHVEGNVIGAGNQVGISAVGVGNLQIRGNRIYSPNGSGAAINLQGVADSVIEDNHVTDVINSYGIVCQVNGSTACARLTIAGNVIRRTNLAGIAVLTGDSLTITGNIAQACGGNAGIDLQGVSNSVITGNICNSNQNDGIKLEDSGGTFCLHNRVTGNTCRDDGSGYNVTTGATWTQQHGIVEAGSSNDNLFTGNECDSNAVDQLVTAGAASYAWGNVISGSPSGDLPVALGGTGQGTAAAAFAALAPLTTLGDLLYENSTPAPARLAGNTTSQVQFLSQTGTGSVSAAPAWAVVSGQYLCTPAQYAPVSQVLAQTISGTFAPLVAAGTTVAAGSNGGEISQIASWSSPSAGVLAVASTTGYPASGTLNVVASGTTVGVITYSGTSGGNTFTGCAYVSGSATGTVATGNAVTAATGTALASTGSFTAPASGDVLVTANFAFECSAAAVFCGFGLAAHGTVTPMAGNIAVIKSTATTDPLMQTVKFLVTGLTPGTSYNLDLMFCVSGTGANTLSVVAIGATGTTPTLNSGNMGAPVVMTVQAV